MATAEDPKARTLIDRWLGRVEAHLADRQAGEREDLLRDLEAHVHDALASRREGDVSATDVEAVLAEMDDPSSYGAPGSRPTPSAPPPPPPPAGPSPGFVSYRVALGIALIGILVPVIATALGAKEDYAISRAERFGLFSCHALLVLASVVALAAWWRRSGDSGPDAALRRLAALGFLLLAAALLATVVGFGVGQLLRVEDRHGATYEEERMLIKEIRETNRIAYVVSLLFVLTGAASAILAYLVGRVALWPRSGDGPALSGWPRAQAAAAPALVSLGLLLGLPAACGAFGLIIADHQHLNGATGDVAEVGIGVLAIVPCLVAQACLIRFTPGILRFVYSPLADGLERRHARGVWVLAAILLVIGVGCVIPRIVMD